MAIGIHGAHQALACFCLAVMALVLLLCFSLPSNTHHMMEIQEAIRPSFSSKPNFIKENYTLAPAAPTANPILSQLTWLEDLSWVIPPVCNGSDPFILAMVITAVDNFEQRSRVRSTWASPEFYKYTGIKAVFVVGNPNNDTLQDALDMEIENYEDIIQTDFTDTYRNLTYKTVSWLSWAKDWCPGTPFIAKIDDDVIVNPFNLRLYLYKHLKNNPSPKNIHGRARFRAKPMRTSKWAVTQEEYPEENYPPIVLGSAYIVDRNAVDVLLANVPYTPFLWLEDVFLTGLVAKRAGIKMKQAERMLYARRLNRKLYYGTLAFLIDPKPKDFRRAWDGILKYSHKIISKLKDS